MNNKVTLAVSAALMSMSMHSAAELSSNPNEGLESFKAIAPTSINKYKNTIAPTQRKTLYKAEKGLENRDYVFIVQLSDDPVAMYDGGVQGLEATNPQRSYRVTATDKSIKQKHKLDIESPQVKAYSSYLEKKQTRFFTEAQAIGPIEKVAEYKFALNAIAIKATPQEAERIAKLPGVKAVERDQVYKLDTDTGPGLIGAPAIWDGTATESGVGRQGEGIVVAVLDTGINSDHPSFQDVGGDGYDHTNPLGSGNYLGDCAGEFSDMCNDKLIGVYSYPEVFSAYTDMDVFPADLPSNGEDYNGHGSHTASTAAGNVLFDVPEVSVEFDANQSDGIPSGFEFERISGVAPHANIIAYAVCQPGDLGDTYSGCLGTPMVSAVEDAIASGIVDVINFSISGGGYPWSGALNAAWLSARNSGIFLAQSAGNDGPDPFTTSKHAPWVTAVAAASHGRSVLYEKEITDFEGGDTEIDPITGTSNSGSITASIVYAGDYENANDPDNDPAQCLQPFPDNTFSGEIVVCDRGEIARVDKAVNAAAGGAGGFVLANVEGGSDTLANDAYIVPGIHITAENGNILKTWLASGEGHTATITGAEGELYIDPNGVDNTADFSSRGPNSSISTLTPSVTAPGVNIYAAYSDEQYGHDQTGTAPADYAYLSGTSMSGPHVAGAAALIKHEKPSWTPDNIRSALMMSASTDVRKEDGVTAADWFDMGAGRVQVDLAVQSGLVMDETDDNYAAADPAIGGEPRSLNIPSITDNNCVGRCTWTRTVTATKDGAWSVDAASISDGLNITVSPATFDLTEGQSQEITVEIDAFSAESDVWSFGVINLTSASSPDLHLPVSIVASNGNIPDKFDFTAHRDQDSYLVEDVMAVEITNFQSVSYGLTKATTVTGSVMQDSDNSDFLDDLEDGLSITTVEVPEGTIRLAASTMDSTSPDLDLFVVHDVNEDGIPQEEEIVGVSATATADEYVNVDMPAAGMYWIIVQNWTASSEGATDTFTLAHAMVDSETGDNLMVEAPSSIPQLTEFDMRLTWDLEGAQEGDIYIGAIALGTDEENPTNLGVIPIDIMRGMDDVYVSALSEERLNPGETATFAVNLMANFTPEDRIYDISLTLPEGVTLVEDSISDGGMVDGETIIWTGIEQESLVGIEPSYVITTNATDAMCKNPELGQGGGAYIDLASFGVGFSDLDGDDTQGTFNVSGSFLGELYSSMTVTDDGFITFGNDKGARSWLNQNMPDAEMPNGVVAPYWRDQEFNIANGSGVSIANAGPDYTIVEWDNMRFWGLEAEYADIADYEVVFVNNAAEGEPNIIYSYTNVIHDQGAMLPISVGYESMAGTTGSTPIYTPYDRSSYSSNLETTITDGTHICMYLDDVSDAPRQLTFDVTVDADNMGGPIQMVAMSEVTNIPGTSSAVSPTYEGLQVEGAPEVLIDGMAEASLEVVELTELALPGSVTEPNGDAVDITWKQVGGPPAVIAGNGLQEAILMAPEVEEDTLVVLELTAVDKNGNSTTATANVMVKNNLPPEITINAPSSVGEGKTITVSASATDPEGDNVSFTINGVPGNTYSMTAPGTNSDTTVSFEVVASDGLNTTTETVSVTVTDKSGGSMGWLALLLVPVAFLRRRKMH